ncbi:MAG: L,D-transpeptidase family protein [Bacteroidota bacterium]
MRLIEELQSQGFDPEQKMELLLRAYKWEEKLEVYLKATGSTTYKHFKSYDFCTNSGTLGPKRKEGDRQIPEGFYYIDRFNPKSKFHLSLGLNYPNQSDRIKGDPQRPGSDIFIHGGCQSIGCIAITDEKIEELFVLAEQMNLAGQAKIPVHIFPFHFDHGDKGQHYHDFFLHRDFWDQLLIFDQYFDSANNLAAFKVNEVGDYYLDP